MIPYLQVENLTKSFGDLVLFHEISFGIAQGQRIGLIAKNGSGKTTLLNILAGKEGYDEGNITFRRDLRVGYLEQSPSYPEELTVLEACFHHGNSTVELIKEYEKCMETPGNPGLEDLLVRMEHEKAWDYERRAKQILSQLKIRHFDQKIKHLSGGQLKRVALANVLINEPDLLILDEPTNHLDYEMVEWLEDYLRRFRGAIIMITHDRYFLDSVCNRIVEVDKGQTYSYDTNYSGFLELKAAREESERASERKRQSILRNEIEWMQGGARARSTKQKAHIQRCEALRDQKGPQTDERVELSSVSSRMGRTTIELHDISKAYGDIVCVKNFTYIFLKNDRIGFVGKNGCGKSTLMKIIAGFIEPDSGEVEIGQTIKIGYFGQEVDIEPELRVIDYVKEAAEFVRTADGLVSATAMLERFLFPPEQQYSPVGKLSGGEKRRLYLLRVLMSAPNVLILDEPTNDLDVETLAILEDYLDGYDGIVITVSHDRYFLDRIAKRIFAFEGAGKIVQYEGGYTDYMNKRPQPASGKTVSENASSTGASASGAQGNTASDGTDSKEARKKKSMETWGHEKKLKFTYKEQKEYETIEADIEKLENRLSEIDDEMVKNATNFGKLNELTKEKEDLEGQLMEKMERW